MSIIVCNRLVLYVFGGEYTSPIMHHTSRELGFVVVIPHRINAHLHIYCLIYIRFPHI